MNFHDSVRALVPDYCALIYRMIRNSLQHRGSEVHPTARFCRGTTLYAPVVVGADVELDAVEAGPFTYFARGSRAENARIGRFCSIASRVCIGGGTHPAREWVSTSPAFYSTRRQAGVTFATKDLLCEVPRTWVGNDVWVGYGAIILPGVHIADGAVVGAGAVVTHEVGAFEIVGGVPARLIRKRFTEDECDILAKLQWWNWDQCRLRSAAKHFRTVADLDRFAQESKG